MTERNWRRPVAFGANPGASGQQGDSSYRGALRAMVPALVCVLCFSAILNVLMLTGSVYMLQVYDRVLASGSVPTLVNLFIIVTVLYGFLGLYDFLRSRMLSRAALRLDQRTGSAAFADWIGTGVPGTAIRAVTPPLRDLEGVRGFLSGPTVPALFDLPFVPLYLAVLFMVHPWLGWLTVAGAAVTGGIALLNRALTQGPIRNAAAVEGTERDFTDKGRRNAETILAMGMQRAITARWQRLHDSALDGAQQGSDPSEMLAAISRAFRMLLQSAILTLGAYLVIQGQISGGMIIASSVLSGRALAPVDQLIGQWRSLGRAAAAHQRLLAGPFANHPEPAERRPAPIALPDPTGQISVTKLTRLVQSGTQPGPHSKADPAAILADISFDLLPGDGLGVIGNSACGKSTLARLLVGVSAPDRGEIRFDGATADQWDPVQLGRRIGYLAQVVDLLPGTIRDNIARFDPAASDTEVIAAARLTGVHEMILKLPQGYATLLGSADSQYLSGGQIQRIGLARAVYGMPTIVVLDEPNSNLDVAGDDALTRTITALRQAGSTVIVMAHRPSAIAAVNKLLILEAGTMRAFGDKEEVLMQATGGRIHAAASPAAQADTAQANTAPGDTTQANTSTETQIPVVRIPVIHPADAPPPLPQPVPLTPHLIRYIGDPAGPTAKTAVPGRKRSA